MPELLHRFAINYPQDGRDRHDEDDDDDDDDGDEDDDDAFLSSCLCLSGESMQQVEIG